MAPREWLLVDAGLCKLALPLLWFDEVPEGRQTNRSSNNQVSGTVGKSMPREDFQSWETHVSKVRQYSRDEEWAAEWKQQWLFF